MNIASLIRCKKIIDEVKNNNYPSKTELQEAVNLMLKNVSNISDEKISEVGEKTIGRDIKAINAVLGIPIEYNRSSKGYFIADVEHSKAESEMLLEASNMFYILQNMDNVRDYVSFEPRKTKKGIEHFFYILGAIRAKRKISFSYLQYEKKEETKRFVSPLGLKEFKGFWYLVAKEKDSIKIFGLDRINAVSTTLEKSDYPADFSLKEYFKHCYGIVRFNDEEPQEIKIKMLPIKAAYYIANPLHASQKVLEETDAYVVMSIYTYLTYDLQKELRSHGEREVSVIQPKDGLITKRYY
ncbi:MAG: WYL domain-containing protein [Bacteroidota bacterium]|nr:WYL domain-containing protein [Bacteroidota bacterium]